MAARTAIGLDIGTSVVRAAEVSYGRAGITLERFGQVVLPEGAVRDGEVVDPEPVVESIKAMWRGAGFSHKNVVMGVANQRVLARPVDLPWLEPAELKSSLAFQVADLLPMPVDSAVLDFFPLEEFTDDNGARMIRGLLVAAARSTVLGNVRCAESAGLTCQAVDLTSFAVLRALGRQSGLDVETEALVDIGARVTNIIVHSAGVPRFVRILLRGGQDVTDSIAETLGVATGEAEAMKQQMAMYGAAPTYQNLTRAIYETADDFVEEIRGSLNYYAASNPNTPVERVLLCGGGSQLEGLRDRLAGALRLPVAQGDPFSMVQIGNTGLDERQLEFIRPLAAVPVGLALGAIR